VWRNESERTLLCWKGCSIECVCNDNSRVHNSRIEFSDREHDSIAVFCFEDQITGQQRSPKVFSLWHAGFFQQVFQEHTLAQVTIMVDDQKLTSLTTADAAAEIGLSTGDNVIALLKSSQIMILRDRN
jgi:molybdopterin-binding protein